MRRRNSSSESYFTVLSDFLDRGKALFQAFKDRHILFDGVDEDRILRLLEIVKGELSALSIPRENE